MKEFNLLASAALFGQLYNAENYHDVTDIIAEFIKNAISQEGNLKYSVHDLTQLLQKHYEFRIPEGVVKTTVRSKLKKLFTREQDFYLFDPSLKNNGKIGQDYVEVKEVQGTIFNALAQFVEGHQNSSLSENDKEELAKNFYLYLIDETVAYKFSQSISGFLIKNSLNDDFRKSINLIKEGIILYQGIRFTADVNQRGRWNTELKVFLSTEHLFNSQGLHGLLFKDIYSEFKELVDEINRAARGRSGSPLIELKYLQETKEEIDNIFYIAQRIVEGKLSLDYTKSALISIIDGCKHSSDIIERKTKFYRALENDGIYLQENPRSIYSHVEFNVEDQDTISAVEAELKERGWSFHENKVIEILRMFTKVNYYRGGTNKTTFENAQAILITANSLALLMSHLNAVKFTEGDIPYAKDIEYLTTKFWFKLKKGFSESISLPKSFDVISKAQVVLATQLNVSVSQKYETLKADLRKGRLTNDDALQLNYEFRQKSQFPEQITAYTVDDALDFLKDEGSYERILHEKVRAEQEFNTMRQERDELRAELVRKQKEEEDMLMEIKRDAFYQRREQFVAAEFNSIFLNIKRDTYYFGLILLLNIVLAGLSVFLAVDKLFKEWVGGYSWFAILVIILYIIIIVLEVQGRSYLFNKERIKKGWQFIFVWFNKRKLDNFTEEKRASLQKRFGEFREQEVL